MTPSTACISVEAAQSPEWLPAVDAGDIGIEVVTGVAPDVATSPAAWQRRLASAGGDAVVYVPAGHSLLPGGLTRLLDALWDPAVVLAVGAACWPEQQGSAHSSEPARRMGIPLSGPARRVEGARLADAIVSYAVGPSATPAAVAIRRTALDGALHTLRWPAVPAPPALADRFVPLWLAVVAQGDAVVLRDRVCSTPTCPEPSRQELGGRACVRWWFDLVQAAPRLTPVERRRAMATLMRRISHLPLPDVDATSAEGSRLAMHALAARLRKELPLSELLSRHDAAPYVQSFLVHPSSLEPPGAAALTAAWMAAFGDRDDVELLVPSTSGAIDAMRLAGIPATALPGSAVLAVGSPVVALGPHPTVETLRRFAPATGERSHR